VTYKNWENVDGDEFVEVIANSNYGVENPTKAVGSRKQSGLEV
jgi:hypothetical protein